MTSATKKKIRKHQHVPKRGIKRPHNADSEAEEEDEGYEAQLRLPQWTDRKNDKENDGEILHYRLPLKDKKGLIQQEPVVLEGVCVCVCVCVCVRARARTHPL